MPSKSRLCHLAVCVAVVSFLFQLLLGVQGAVAGPVQQGERFKAWLAELWQTARDAGISRSTFVGALGHVQPDPSVIEASESQPEFVKPVWEYLDRAVSATRIADGKAKLLQLEAILADIERTYGVDREVLVAIWGMESAYGVSMGEHHVVRSLATLGFQGSRQKFGSSQLVAALQILQRGDVKPESMIGSWAGAMGHTQFIPTTYNSYAVDYDRDGRRDIWSTPADALASTANYLRHSGWIASEPWGHEVVLPRGFDFAESGMSVQRSIVEWLGRGVTRADGQPFEAWALEGSVLLPAGARGPAYLVFRNFRAVLRYNNATAYALAVGQLADRLSNRPGPFAKWPRDDLPLTQSQRHELQELLAAKGFYKGGVDGRIGSMTETAIRNYQHRVGLQPDGHPSTSLLERLRRDS